MNTLQDAGRLKLKNGLSDLGSILAGKDQFSLAGAGHLDLCIAIDIAVSMTG